MSAATAAVMVKILEDGRIQLSGGTYLLKDQIRANRGRWNPAERVWTLPAGTDTAFITEAMPVIAPSRSPSKPPALTREEALAIYSRVAAAVALPRRDGRCCDSSVSFWPADDPHAHYGPASYRCPHHGETRGNYSGT
jgi:hypothetical protein